MIESPVADQRRSIASVVRLLSGASPGATEFREHGLLGSIVPAAPDDPLPNLVTYDRRPTADQIERLTQTYLSAGITRWSAWADDDDSETAVILKDAGYRLHGRQPGMSLPLDTWQPPSLDINDGCTVSTEASDLRHVGLVNQLARPESPKLSAALVNTPTDLHSRVRVYRAYDGTHPTAVAVLVTIDHLRDCAIHFVATAPQARRRGHASKLLTAALVHAIRRDCATASLQAEAPGAHLYQSFGFDARAWFDIYRYGG